MRTLLITILKAYRYIFSPWLGNNCRFHPSCSCYAEEAFTRHGVLRGGWLTLRRLGRCHPWCEGGVDLVPERANTVKDTPSGRHG
jgi:uncharacterized protein